MKLLKTFCLLLLLCLFSLTVLGNTDRRKWHLGDGSTIDAELVSCDLETGKVILKIREEEEK